jgi:hypothetical protein
MQARLYSLFFVLLLIQQSIQQPSTLLINVPNCNPSCINGCNAINNGIAQSFEVGNPTNNIIIGVALQPGLYYPSGYTLTIYPQAACSGQSLAISTNQVNLPGPNNPPPSNYYNFSFDPSLVLNPGNEYTWQLNLVSGQYSSGFVACGQSYTGGILYIDGCQAWPGPAHNAAFQLYGTPTTSNSPPPAPCDTPSSLATIDPPTLVPLTSGTTGFLSQNVLTLQWNWVTVQTRTNPTVTFLSNGGSLSNPLAPAVGCSFPTPSLSTPVGCNSVLTVNLPWTGANPASCGFYKTATAISGVSGSSDVWTGFVSLSAVETVSAGRSLVNRTFENTFQLTLSFQKYASVSSSIYVAAAVNVTAAVISEEYGTVSAGKGTLQFVLQVGYPYMLSLQNEGGPMDSVIGATPAATALTTVSNSPATASGTYSTGTFQLTITPSASMCQLNGQYLASNTRFQLQCTPNAIKKGQCPKLNNAGAGITLTVVSSSFCAQVVENVGVTLSMNSYSDSNFQTANPSFVIQPNGFMYFLVSVQSSPKVSVTSLTIDQVTINSPHLPNSGVVLYDSINSNPALTSSGITFQYNVNSFTLPSGGVYAGFSIGEVSAWNVLQDTLDSATVSAQITVGYQGGQKRSLAQSSGQSTLVATTSPVFIHGASASIISSVVLLFTFGVFVLLI